VIVIEARRGKDEFVVCGDAKIRSQRLPFVRIDLRRFVDRQIRDANAVRVAAESRKVRTRVDLGMRDDVSALGGPSHRFQSVFARCKEVAREHVVDDRRPPTESFEIEWERTRFRRYDRIKTARRGDERVAVVQ
jgi:hypothetical protein